MRKAQPREGRSVRKRSKSREPRPVGRSRLPATRSEEHTSELQSQSNLVCRLLLEKKRPHIVISNPAPVRSRSQTHTADAWEHAEFDLFGDGRSSGGSGIIRCCAALRVVDLRQTS